MKMVVFGLTIVYIICCITGLVSDKRAFDDCAASLIWYYVMISVIYHCLGNFGNLFFDKNERHTWFIFVFFFVVSLSLGIWGLREVNDLFTPNNVTNVTNVTNCTNLPTTTLGTMALITVILQYVYATLIMIILVWAFLLFFVNA